jgi:hypothetical protein
MAEPRTIRSIYWHYLNYPIRPKVLVDPAETQEIDPPYRRGVGFAYRLPLTNHAIVIGKWISSHDESTALTYAISGRVATDEIDWDTVRDI